MQNKKMVYILVPFVVIIWGLIIFRVYDFIDNKDIIQAQPVRKFDSVIAFNPLDTYNIKTRRFDPFLQNNKVKEVLIEEEPREFNFEKPEMDFSQYFHKIAWPEITYSGSIENSGIKNRIGLLKLGNQQILIREDQNILGIQVIKIYNDSIILNLSGDRRTFSKQKI
jgi:hypothetical protein